GTEWIGRVVQESLLTDAAKINMIHILDDQRPGTTDLATARQMARDVHADLVLLGGYQTSTTDNLKITGQLLNASTNEVLATLQSTATIRDVLEMQDTLSRQLQRALTRATKTAHQTPTPRYSEEPDPPATIPDSGPVRIANYSTTYLPIKSDPLQKYRDRNTYVGPPFYGYGYYYGFGFGYGYFNNYSFPGYPYVINPANIFYGD
ncbi:MAG TPA: hypothetical protein VHS31_06170, partial [Tepidisphaeraceae bacterium]|nr:hypothetical protein [Tepidisphaeraceae bacterium]